MQTQTKSELSVTTSTTLGWKHLSMLFIACFGIVIFVSACPNMAPPADDQTTGDPVAGDPVADDPMCRPPCDNRDVCDGEESCVDGTCVAGTPLVCDDGLFCNGQETCDSMTGCQSAGNPCASDESCNEDVGSCDIIPTLEVTGILPNQGAMAGGTLIIIRGDDFRDPMLVLFGGTASPDVSVLASDTLAVVSPPGNQGPVDLRLFDPDGVELVLENAFTYISPPSPPPPTGGGPPTQNDTTDTDGDGLLDREETTPRTILIDISGFGPGAETSLLTTRLVTSDPTLADTDGDGLNDLEEFVLQTDPSVVDTDGDGLTDEEEWNRWHTSPVSVDTDGDSRVSGNTQAPNAALFDGLELYELGDLNLLTGHPASQVSTRNLKARATSPTLADTDGDGKTDREEFDDTLRSNLVADMPTVSITMQGKIDIQLVIEYEESNGMETMYGEEFSTSTTDTSSTSTSESVAVEEAASGGFLDDIESDDGLLAGLTGFFVDKGLEIGQQAACGALNVNKDTSPKFDLDNPQKLAADVNNFEDGVIATADALGVCDMGSPKTTTTNTTTLTNESSKSAQQLHSKYLTESRTQTERASSGEIIASLKIRNTSVFAFKVDQLFMTMLHRQNSPSPNSQRFGEGAFRTIGTLRPEIDDLDIILGPGESTDLITVNAGDVNAAVIKQLLARPSAIFYAPASVELLDQNGLSFDFITEQVSARTASITIDYGGGSVEQFQVATNVNRDPNGEIVGTTLATILKDVLRIPFETQISRPADDTILDDEGDLTEVLVRVRNKTNRIPTTLGDPFMGELHVGGTEVWMVYLQEDSQVKHCENGDNANGVCLTDLDCPITGTCLLDDEPCIPANEGSDCPMVGDTCMPVDLTSTCLNPKQNFYDIRVRHGDVVRIQYSSDMDNDGLFAREEGAVGSSDGKFDTDGDGLTDFQEVRVGWLININFVDPDNTGAKYQYRTYSDPSSVDQDGDGVTDDKERLGRDGWLLGECNPLDSMDCDLKDATDPGNADTDDDGLLDNLDPFPLSPAKRLYVDQSNIGNDADSSGTCISNDCNTGKSWDLAFGTLKGALDAAMAAQDNNDMDDISTTFDDVSEIWLSAGTYNSTNDGLYVPSHIAIYGGFLGDETARSQRSTDLSIPRTFVQGSFSVFGQEDVLFDSFVMKGVDFALFNSAFNIINSKHISLVNLVVDGVSGNALTSPRGGVMHVYSRSWGIRIERCLFKNNEVGLEGGAIYANVDDDVRPADEVDIPTMEIIDSIFVGNSITGSYLTDLFGGTISIHHANEVVIEGTEISNSLITITPNTASAHCFFSGEECVLNGPRTCGDYTSTDPTDGACCAGTSPITCSDVDSAAGSLYCRSLGLSASCGCVARIETDFCKADTVDTTRGDQFGGAVYFDGSSGQIKNSVFRNNKIETCTGACAFSFNDIILDSLVATGGALHFDQRSNPGQWNILNCLFAENEAIRAGGAIMRQSSTSIFNITNTTFVDNEVVVTATPPIGLGAAMWGSCFGISNPACTSRSTKLRNCIIYNNVPTMNSIRSEDAEYCLIEGAHHLFLDLPGNIDVDPKLTATNSLMSDSPCIDTGTNIVDIDPSMLGFQLLPPTDLGDNPRIVDGDGDETATVDMGCYEYQP